VIDANEQAVRAKILGIAASRAAHRSARSQIAIDGMLFMQRSANIERLWRMPAIL
jgi:hypothetical protein